jgi:hypothetical protein
MTPAETPAAPPVNRRRSSDLEIGFDELVALALDLPRHPVGRLG